MNIQELLHRACIELSNVHRRPSAAVVLEELKTFAPTITPEEQAAFNLLLETPREALSEERRQFLHDVIVTAVEGGINYWAHVSEYKFSSGDSQDASARVLLEEPDDIDGYPREGKVVTIEFINEAIIKMLRTPAQELGIHTSYVARIFLAHNNNDASYLDASDCDNIFQFALLGKVIYG